MRNSPINHLRHGRDSGESPYQSAIHRSGHRDHSPERILSSINASDAEYWRQRAKNLEANVLGLNEELSFMERKLQKIDQLEQKIQVLLAQNSHLVDENQSLIKLIQQKKAQAEMWRSRFEGQFANSNLAEAEKKKIFDHLNLKGHEHQVQLDRLLSEISRLQDEKVQMESMKQIEINSLKNRYESQAMSQIQTLKRSQYGNNQLQELNIRKLKDQLEEKNFEIENIKRQGKLEAERFHNQINFLKNQVKKIEQQREHQADLLKTENDNQRNNLIRTHRKNQEQLKNLHQAKIKRLNYELQQRKNEIEEWHGKIRKGGKENEAELNRMVNDKSKLRQQMRDGDNLNRQRIEQLTQFYESQINQLRNNNQQREKNLIQLYNGEIGSLSQIIQAKQEQIQRLLNLNADIKKNEERRLADIKSNNEELKKKISDLIMHYEREVELMKIKISQLYEADLDALRTNMQNRLAAHNRERDNLREILQETLEKLAKQVQDRLDLRKEYENRLNQIKIKYQREHQQYQDLLMQREKQIENQTSKFSLTYIEHNQKMQKDGHTKKELMNQIITLTTQIKNKNNELQAVNEKSIKQEGFLKNQIRKLEQQIIKLKDEHQGWIDRQDRQNQDWNRERAEFKEQIHALNLKTQQNQKKNKGNEDELMRKLEQKRLQVASLSGTIEEMEKKIGQWQSKHRVQVSNIEKNMVDTEALMNSEKTKLTEVKEQELRIRHDQARRVRDTLQKQIDDLKKENDLLRDNNAKAKIREVELTGEVSNLLDSVNKRSVLEEHVINIGLSNNYFKNVAEIFKRQIQQ